MMGSRDVHHTCMHTRHSKSVLEVDEAICICTVRHKKIFEMLLRT